VSSHVVCIESAAKTVRRITPIWAIRLWRSFLLLFLCLLFSRRFRRFRSRRLFFLFKWSLARSGRLIKWNLWSLFWCWLL